LANFLGQVESDHVEVLTFEVELKDSMKDFDGTYKMSFVEAHKQRKVPNPESQLFKVVPQLEYQDSAYLLSPYTVEK
jgi:hypothetical protein